MPQISANSARTSDGGSWIQTFKFYCGDFYSHNIEKLILNSE